jgi:hypothetical protein
MTDFTKYWTPNNENEISPNTGHLEMRMTVLFNMTLYLEVMFRTIRFHVNMIPRC